MANNINVPIPQNPIGENFAWRDWLQKLSNKVYGSMANQDSGSVVITGGSINGTTIGSSVPSTGKFTTLDATTTRTTNLLVGSGTNGQILVGRTSDHAFLPATLGTGTGISVTTGAGSMSISNSGVTSAVAGTGISVSSSTGAVTIANTGVTSVTGTSPVASSGGATPAISLAASYGDTQNPYASKTANYFLGAPNGSAGVPTFRALVVADVTGLGTMATQNTGISTTVALAKLTLAGSNGSLTVSNGIITAYTAPT